MRPTWDEYFTQIVLVTKERSACERLKVGCVLVKDNRIISQQHITDDDVGDDPLPEALSPSSGHRDERHIYTSGLAVSPRSPRGACSSPACHEQATVHAEQNALMDCAKRGASCNGCTAYITHYPCLICARLLLAAGIKKIKYIENYKNDELVELFANQCDVSLEQLIS